ncbi:hypothetical protein M3Y99_01560600 [Aphelenchoides fujianensis]|nr:hypothetical protein M3Y99_01560600 [Aphelenchoides fujianensis]
MSQQTIAASVAHHFRDLWTQIGPREKAGVRRRPHSAHAAERAPFRRRSLMRRSRRRRRSDRAMGKRRGIRKSAISSSGVNAESGTTTGHDSASTHSSAGCSCDRCETAGRRREEASRAADEPPERPLSSARRSMNAADRAAMDEREFLCERRVFPSFLRSFFGFRFTTTEPTCSHSLLSLEKKPKLHRLGEKLKKFITPRDEHHARQFQRLFSDYLAADEELIATFSCLYHDPERKLPLSGRLFVSSLSLAFSASAVHVRFVVPLVQVQRIVREQYARVRPNPMAFGSTWTTGSPASSVLSPRAKKPTPSSRASGSRDEKSGTAGRRRLK